MEVARVVTLSELIDLDRPLSGSASLSFSSCTAVSRSVKKQKIYHDSLLSKPDGNASTSSFAPINVPVVLIGIVGLYSTDEPDLCGDSGNYCFSFSDGSSRVCCALLNFDPRILAREVRVLAWNFVTFEGRGGGFLEIIRWGFPSSETFSSEDPLLSIRSSSLSGETPCGGYRVHGVLKAVSPVFSLPWAPESSSKLKDGERSVGFLAKLACSCETCRNSQSSSKSLSSIIYLIEPTSLWRPLLVKLLGKSICIVGLKKNRVSPGGAESHLMFIAKEEAVLSLYCPREDDLLLVGKEKSSLGIDDEPVFSGTVTGIHMRGMVIELDKKVWLLVTVSSAFPLHSLGAGSIVSIRNFHLFRLRFSWSTTFLIGTCARTVIDVKSFSTSHIRCCCRLQKQSLLIQFLESANSSTRFWILLTVSSFRKKFSGIFSEVELLGSKNKEGLAQIFCRPYMLSDTVEAQPGTFLEFCRNDKCSIRSDLNLLALKLAAPLSNFYGKCESLWASIIPEVSDHDRFSKSFLCEGKPYCSFIRRIFSSEDFGCVLVGTLKFSKPSGRIQLVDATGTVDVVIPDFKPNMNVELKICKVQDYKVILEGFLTDISPSIISSDESFSCRNIFGEFPHKKVVKEMTVYIQFHLRDLKYIKILPLPSYLVRHNKLGSGVRMFHLVFITHKFPINSNGFAISAGSSMFAEAVTLPYVLILLEENEDSENPDCFPCKKKGESHCYNSKRGRIKIPCVLDHRISSSEEFQLPCCLCARKSSILENFDDKRGLKKLLLRFSTENSHTFKCLRIGSYYTLRCSKEDTECGLECCVDTSHSLNIIDGQSHFSSIYFSFLQTPDLGKTQADEKVNQSDLVFQPDPHLMPEISEISLHLSNQVTGVINGDLAAAREGFIKMLKLFAALIEVLSATTCIQLLVSEFKRPIATSGPVWGALPVGSLISLQGNIENIHIESSHASCPWSENFPDFHLANEFSVCIHVHDDHNMVLVRGTLTKYTYPIGLGPGANATFYRILLSRSSCGSHVLMLTPVSFIVINSVKEVCGHFYERQIHEDIHTKESSSTISRSIFCNLEQYDEKSQIQFHCRVDSVHLLVLEKISQREFKVLAAGFVLDDGSALCYGWAENVNAVKLFGLHDTCLQLSFNFYDDFISNFHVRKVMKNGQIVVVENIHATEGSAGIELSILVDARPSRSLEENLLRTIMLNACSQTNLFVLGERMDPIRPDPSIAKFIKAYPLIQSMKNHLRIIESGILDPIHESWSLLCELSTNSD